MPVPQPKKEKLPELGSIECSWCKSVFAYDSSDVETEKGDWYRTGMESSERRNEDSVLCPVCGKKEILRVYHEEW